MFPHDVPGITLRIAQSSECLSVHPPLNAKSLLLLCGDIETNPGPSMEETVKRLENKVDSQGERVEEKLNKLITLMDTSQHQYTQLNKQLQKLEDSITKSIELVQSKIVHLEDFVSSLEHRVITDNERVYALEEGQDTTLSKISKLENELERQERYSRRSNVLIYGMREESAETYNACMGRVLDILQRYFSHKQWLEVDIERTHRLGPKSPDNQRPRPVIIRFQRWSDAMSVMRDREGKTRLTAEEAMRVAADLTGQQRDTIREFKAQGKHAYYTNGKLIVQDSQHHVQEFRSYNQDFRPHSHRHRSGPTDRPSTYEDPATSTVLTQERSYSQVVAAIPIRDKDVPTDDDDDEFEDAEPMGCPKDAVKQTDDPAAAESREPKTPLTTTEPCAGTVVSPRFRGLGRGTPSPEHAPRHNGHSSAPGGSGGRGKRIRADHAGSQKTQERTRDSFPSQVQTRNRRQSVASFTRQGTMEKHLSKSVSTTASASVNGKKSTEKSVAR